MRKDLGPVNVDSYGLLCEVMRNGDDAVAVLEEVFENGEVRLNQGQIGVGRRKMRIPGGELGPKPDPGSCSAREPVDRRRRC